MKTKHPIFFLLLAVIALFATACNNDDLANEKGDPAVIAMTLNNAQTRGGDLFAEDALITKVRIYVFNGNYVDAMQVYNSGTDEFENPFRIKTTTGAKTVYVIANEPAGMTAALDGVTTLTGLKALTTPESVGPLEVPLTMVGSEVTNVQYAADPGPYTQVTVKLTRLATMLNLTVKKGESTTADIILKAVRLFRAPAKSTLEAGQSVAGQTYWNHTYLGAGPIPITTDGIDAWTGATPMYLYENPGSIADTTDRATYIIIDATYNGVDTRYRAYINDVNSDALDHKYSTKRNHKYNLVATINNIGEFDGLILSTFVTQWTLLQSDILFDRIYTISPHPTTANHTYEVTNPDDLVTFTFKLDNPVGANWIAHLSNPINFEFSNIGGAVSSGGLGTEYTISIKAKNAQGAELVSTEFYITVDGTEIPLLQGSTLIGEGNRIIVEQPANTQP